VLKFLRLGAADCSHFPAAREPKFGLIQQKIKRLIAAAEKSAPFQ
jgi:hypothetical protein